MTIDRRAVLRGALTLPVVAGTLLTLGTSPGGGAGPGAGPIAAPGASPGGAATPPAAPRSPRYRSWDVETLDRRLRVAGRA